MKKKIAVLVGSLRKDSYTKKVVLALKQRAPTSLEMEIVEIGHLPLYNQDQEESAPTAWLDFRKKIKESDGILFATPEYNRSIPAALKNAIDVGSRPYGKSAWEGKPGAVISVSPGAIGGFGANHHLRQCLVFLDVPCLQQPESYVGNINNLLDESGMIKNKDTSEFLVKFIEKYAKWVELNSKTKT